MDSMVTLDLSIFDGEGGGAPAGGTQTTTATHQGGSVGGIAIPHAKAGQAAKAAQAAVKYGKQPEESAEKPGQEADITVTGGDKDANRAEFERLIKGDYRDAFGERVQRIIDERFKGVKGLEERVESMAPLMDMLASRYNVKADDVPALLKALEQDSGFYEQEAMEKGMTVEQLREFKQMERENARFREMLNRQRQQEEANRTYGEWMRQGEELKGIYPGFDMAAEARHPETGQQFLALLKNHVPIRTAYEVIHKDEIMGGAMHYTAQQVRKQTVDDIRTRGLRPEENGAGGQGPAQVKADVRSLTKEDRREIERRVMRGERIVFAG